jgi:tetratricopeptide (TPR) repeat protein
VLPRLVFVLCVFAAAPALAADARIDQADRLIREELRYKAGITLLERALEDRDLGEADRVEAYRLLGVAYVARDKPQSAEAAFEALLAIDPSYTLDVRLSPKIRAVFERAQAKVAPRLVDVTAIPEGRRVVVSARIEDPRDALVAVELYARAGDEPFERHTMTRREDRAAAVVEVPSLSQLRLDYYLVGRSEDAALVTVADATAPLSVVVARTAAPAVVTRPKPTPEDPPIYTRWWFWTAAAVVVAGAVVGGVVLASSGSDTPDGTLPPVSL